MLLTATELATHLKTSLGHIYRLARTRQIPAHQLGRSVRFELADVLQSTTVEPRTMRRPNSASTALALLRLQQRARTRRRVS